VDGSTKYLYRQQMARIASRVTETPRSTEEYGAQLDALFDTVIRWFQKPANNKWLHIVDNVDRDSGENYAIKKLLPRTIHGSILITTRDVPLSDQFGHLELKKFGLKNSLELLSRRSKKLPKGNVPTYN
jgi:hypothetical protein